MYSEYGSFSAVDHAAHRRRPQCIAIDVPHVAPLDQIGNFRKRPPQRIVIRRLIAGQRNRGHR